MLKCFVIVFYLASFICVAPAKSFKVNNSTNDNNQSTQSLENALETFIKSKDVAFQLPLLGKLTMDSRKLNDEEINFRLNFANNGSEERGKKYKLKKVLIPILTLVLLKAVTIVPFILGALTYKAYSSLKFALGSFVISAALAIFQICQKLAANSQSPVVLDHPPFDHYDRSITENGLNLAYSGHAQ
ncbi:hypothetical protein ABEB36_008908 [Hypothenemus hampei]|uniref:Osiris 19 n=1 Tax=Hypothenemus hampei TaxID=57062 RepID=A0ABD1ENG7_HYPHA